MVDAIILILLVATIGYAFMLERRLRALMGALRDLAPTVNAFSAAVDRTEGSVQLLRSATKSAGRRQRRNPNARRGSSARRAAGTETVKANAKADLIRSFFDTARGTRA